MVYAAKKASLFSKGSQVQSDVGKTLCWVDTMLGQQFLSPCYIQEEHHLKNRPWAQLTRMIKEFAINQYIMQAGCVALWAWMCCTCCYCLKWAASSAFSIVPPPPSGRKLVWADPVCARILSGVGSRKKVCLGLHT